MPKEVRTSRLSSPMEVVLTVEQKLYWLGLKLLMTVTGCRVPSACRNKKNSLPIPVYP